MESAIRTRKRSLKKPEATASEAERLAIIRLIQSQGIGPVRFFALYERYGNALSIIENFQEATQALKHVRLAPEGFAEKTLEQHHKKKIRLVTFLDDVYPPLLQEIHTPPPVISLVGNPEVLQKPLVAVVGSRNASLNARRFVQRLVEDLNAAGWSVVSGFARGLDTVAHEASKAQGTVAVLAGGVDVVYPEENQSLYQQIQEKGCAISEMPLGVVPQGNHFPRRNRLISGMARGVIVGEARVQSGSMLTAEYALEQGREVFAIPGFPMDPRSRGGNKLLKQGATLVETAEDVLAVMGEPVSSILDIRAEDAVYKDASEEQLLSLLSAEPVHADALLASLGWAPASFYETLTRLELEGKVAVESGGQVMKVEGNAHTG